MKKSGIRSAFILCLVLLATAIVFAGGQTETKTAEGSVNLVVWLSDYQQEAFADVQAAFMAENPHVNIINEVMGVEDLRQRLLLAATAGAGAPDVVTMETSHLAQFVQIGALQDITEQTAPYVDKMLAYQWMDASMDGRRYAMPIDSGPVALYYRRDIFEKAGLPSSPEEVAVLLDTYEDFYETAKIIKEKTGVYMFAKSAEQVQGRTFEKLMFQRGVWYFDENGDVSINGPEQKEILDFLHRMHQADLLEDVIPWTQAWYDSFANGESATHLGAVWMSGFLKTWIAPDTEGLWGVAPLPVFTSGDSRTSNEGGSVMAIPATAQQKDLAWEYVDFSLGRAESHISYAERVDQFPSLIAAYGDPYFAVEDSFYLGQQALQVFADAIVDAPQIAYTQNFELANEIMAILIYQVLNGQISPEQALVRAEQQLNDRMVR